MIGVIVVNANGTIKLFNHQMFSNEVWERQWGEGPALIALGLKLRVKPIGTTDDEAWGALTLPALKCQSPVMTAQGLSSFTQGNGLAMFGALRLNAFCLIAHAGDGIGLFHLLSRGECDGIEAVGGW